VHRWAQDAQHGVAGLVIAFWLAGRWIVTPLSRLNVQADQIAGGDLEVSPPRARIGEVANVAAAIDGMAAALGERGQRQDEVDEARRFFVAAAAHDLRTPLFALRGHLEAITTGLGDPEEHLFRAGGNAAALERLIASLFSYARHDYARQEPLRAATGSSASSRTCSTTRCAMAPREGPSS
jgi:signal transduction histidine kinase